MFYSNAAKWKHHVTCESAVKPETSREKQQSSATYHVSRSLVELARKLSIADIELHKGVTRR